ncbi:integrase domain-containing protein [Acidovorax sp. LjRoot118]|uniref:tyrosine-type recombinase/integrase n=1 Tax=Acidovorax sp. LjRoot118 TaxID=3342256 RepID=UPI003ECE2588
MTNPSAASSSANPELQPFAAGATLPAEPHRRAKPPTPRFRRRPAESSAQDAIALAVSQRPGDPWGQLAVFFKNFRIPAAQGRKRSVSAGTETKYVQSITLLIQTLAAQNIRIQNLPELSQKHLVLVMQEWEARELSASSLATRFSCIARFYGWLGKNLSVKSVKDTLQNPAAGMRQYSAVLPKAWNKVGVDLVRLLPQVEAQCRYSAVYLALAREFGLRVQEAAALRPMANDMGVYLHITHGAKGGRGRAVPIETPEQRRVLDVAKEMAHPRSGLLRPSDRTIKQAIKTFYRVMNKVGITRKQLGVTAHGLRHEYANAIYAAHAGVDAPVNGGLAPDRQTELNARKVVTENLGHGRLSVTTAYTGSHANIERHELKRMHQVLDVLQAPGGELSRFVLATEVELNTTHRAESPTAAELELRLYVIGPEAEGKGPHYMPLMLAIRICDRSGIDIPGFSDPLQDIITKLSPLVRQQTGRMCLIHDARLLPADIPQLELLLR